MGSRWSRHRLFVSERDGVRRDHGSIPEALHRVGQHKMSVVVGETHAVPPFCGQKRHGKAGERLSVACQRAIDGNDIEMEEEEEEGGSDAS